MATPENDPKIHHHFQNPINSLTSFFSFPKPPFSYSSKKILLPIPPQPILSLSSPPESHQTSPNSTNSPASFGGARGFPNTVRISSLNGDGNKGGGPAFVGQVYSMCDLSGTGLMAVSTHFNFPPFLSNRTPEWIKKIFTSVGKRERNGPVFRFFMDLGDAVSYVRRLNIPSGVVGACRLDLAYEHFKEKPHLFQFVPNEKQVKEANKLLKIMPQNGARKKVDGVPVFSAQNLDIAIATTDGIKWYTPYFFDKKMLDNILEDSVDQHFHSMIQTRNLYRRKDVFDDNLTSEMAEEIGESMEPPEVQDVIDELGHPEIPLSVVSKVAEIQLLYAVDKVLLGNRWLRKAAGIQPKFPYMVDSFEKRTAASLLRASESLSSLADSESDHHKHLQDHSPIGLAAEPNVPPNQVHGPSFQFPFGDWFRNPWSKQQQNHDGQSDRRVDYTSTQELQSSPFLPKITMVGISTGEAGQLSKAKLKQTMDELTRELELPDQGNATVTESKCLDRDPLFVSNVGDYYSGVGKGGSPRFVRGGIN